MIAANLQGTTVDRAYFERAMLDRSSLSQVEFD
jgi:hypothetical protein